MLESFAMLIRTDGVISEKTVHPVGVTPQPDEAKTERFDRRALNRQLRLLAQDREVRR
jgi:hypothetical protein